MCGRRVRRWHDGRHRRARAAADSAEVDMKAATIVLLLLVAAGPKFAVTDIGAAHDGNHVEFRGVAAGEFEPRRWEEAGSLHFVPDIRSPLLEPRDAGDF